MARLTWTSSARRCWAWTCGKTPTTCGPPWNPRWTLYLLSSHPEAEQALHAELARLDGRRPGFEDLAGLSYTRAVIAESMRLFPPAWILSRALSADADFAGWHAPAGTIVALSPLLLHHDACRFPDPERFDPGRWLDDRRDAVPRHAYIPFGTGPRSCIGEQFAWSGGLPMRITAR